jgi:1-hydroxycarotenoid 3,4-desaturase
VGIIGAGIGGLAAALDLANQGFDVTVFDQAATPGGKIRSLAIGNAPVDAGPTVFTMRWVFESLFADAGESIDQHLILRPATLLARHAWYNDARLDLFADVKRSAEAIGDFAGPQEARAFLAFCQRAQGVYAALEQSFIRDQRPSLPALVARMLKQGPGGMAALFRISPFTSLWRALGQHFRDERLRQLFARYATYCGSSPFQAPATLMLVSHVEQQGVWYIEGGMHRLAKAIESIARARGVRFCYDSRITEITAEDGAITGLTYMDASGAKGHLQTENIIANCDVNAIAAGHFGQSVASAMSHTPRKRRSLSALTWTLTGRAHDFPLIRHNVFFSRNYRREFDDIFTRQRLPVEPTVYICAQDRMDAAAPSDSSERFLVLVNAPAIGDEIVAEQALSAEEIQRCEKATFDQLRRCGLTLNLHTPHKIVTTPKDWEQLFPGTGGALYGRASHGWMASFQRPAAKTRIRGLYLAGGSSHPGPGIAMSALSGRLAVQALLTDQISASPHRTMAMPGGMSMR